MRPGDHALIEQGPDPSAFILFLRHNPPRPAFPQLFEINTLNANCSPSNPFKLTLDVNEEHEILCTRNASNSVTIVINPPPIKDTPLTLPAYVVPQPPPPRTALSCSEFLAYSRNHEVVACSQNTESGYYWDKRERISPYFTSGVEGVGPDLACGAAYVGSEGQSARYPPAAGHEKFLPVKTRCQGQGTVQDANFRCTTVGAGTPVPDANQVAYCGVFRFVCVPQPQPK
jgi:hypothetical protein